MSQRSPGYVFTLDPMSSVDDDALRGLRQAVRRVNRDLTDVRYRVSLSPRACRPEYKWKYQNKFKPRLRLEDASAVDVYLSAAKKGARSRHLTGRAT